MSTIFLYKFAQYTTLIKWDQTIDRINMPGIQYDIKLYKDVPNHIDFIVKNNENKPLKLLNVRIEVQIQYADTPSNSSWYLPEILIKKECKIIDELLGKVRLTLMPNEIEIWKAGYYRYVIQMYDDDNLPEYLYTDINKSVFGKFELIEGVTASISPPIEFFEYQFTPTPVNWWQDTMWVSGAIPGDAQFSRISNLHNVAVYQDNFIGKFWIQGSLAINPPQESEWFNIRLTNTADYFEFTTYQHYFNGPIPFSFNISLYWIRFLYQPDAINIGRINKVLYKN